MVTLRARRRRTGDEELEEQHEHEQEDEPAAARARAPPPPPPPPPPRRRPQPAVAVSVLRSAFLPAGYPDSVSPDYAPFVFWNAVQGLSSYIRGVLASAAVFQSLGVGQGGAGHTALAAATLTAARDAAGTAGGILFTWLQGGSFDAAAKQWRLFADVLNDAAMALDLASPLVAAAFGAPGLLAIASAAALARALVGVAAGATGAALTQHFARAGEGAGRRCNPAEIAAKADSRERAASVVGSFLGVGAARLCARAGPWSGWALFALLTLVHVWANARAVRSLVLDTLTPARLELLLLPPLATARAQAAVQAAPASPRDLAARETLLPPPFERAAARVRALFAGRRPPPRIRFGVRLGELLQRERRREEGRDAAAAASLPLGHALAALRRRSALPDSYLVAWGGGGQDVLVALRRDGGGDGAAADADARLRAYVHALRLALQVSAAAGRGAAAATTGAEDDDDKLEAAAARWAKSGREYGRWLRAAQEAGWQVAGSAALLPRPEHEGDW